MVSAFNSHDITSNLRSNQAINQITEYSLTVNPKAVIGRLTNAQDLQAVIAETYNTASVRNAIRNKLSSQECFLSYISATLGVFYNFII